MNENDNYKDFSEIYEYFLKAFFSLSDRKIKDIFCYWVSNGVCKKDLKKSVLLNFFKTEKNPNKRNNKTQYQNDLEQLFSTSKEKDEKILKKKIQKEKKKKNFYINDKHLIEKEHIGYVFFKEIILLKPTFYVIGPKIYLFTKNEFSIRMHMFNNDLLKLYIHVYINRKSYFSNIMFPLCQNIFSGVKISVKTISLERRRNLLLIFHECFMKKMMSFLDIIIKEPTIINPELKEKDEREFFDRLFLTSIEIYCRNLIRLKNEINIGAIPIGIYETEKKEIIETLDVFIEELKNLHFKIKKRLSLSV